MERQTEAYTYIVRETDEQRAKNAGRLAMIADGKAPGTIIHMERVGDSTEVVMTHRPLRADQGWMADGRRYGNAGSKADR
jgi:hypothetical protein